MRVIHLIENLDRGAVENWLVRMFRHGRTPDSDPPIKDPPIKENLQTMKPQDCLSIVYSSLQRVNAMRPRDQQIPENPDVALVGESGTLDSLALTTLVLALEEDIQERTGQNIVLIDDSSLDGLTATFRTPRTIADHISSLL